MTLEQARGCLIVICIIAAVWIVAMMVMQIRHKVRRWIIEDELADDEYIVWDVGVIIKNGIMDSWIDENRHVWIRRG